MGKWGQFLRKKEASPAEDDEAAETSQRPAQGELGRLLRETREEKRVDLDDIEQQTRIRAKYLLALEEARYGELPTPGHVHGFLRNYAVYLGLDMEEVETLYAQDRAARPFFEPKIFHPKNITLIPRKPMFKADLVLALVVVLVVAAVGWVFWQYGWPMIRPGPTPTPTATSTPASLSATSTPVPSKQVSARPSATPTHNSPASTATPAPATATVEPTPSPSATPTLDTPLTIATPTSAPTDTPTPMPTRTEGIVLHIKVIDRVWLQVTVDDRELAGELLEVGEERDWEGETSIYMICGNAGGIEVTVNGEELGVLGERAQVVERVWGPEGEITPTPEA